MAREIINFFVVRGKASKLKRVRLSGISFIVG